MYDYLIFQLYGPMASWGDIAVGEARPSATVPSKSAIIGMIAAALGIKRSEEQRQQALAESLVVGFKVLNSGSLMRDYHTSQVPGQERKRVFHTREQEINHSAKLNTILSSRDYRMDSYSLVAVRLTDTSEFSLEQIEQALKTPKYALYLGRKSCPLAAPLSPLVALQMAGLQAAFEQFEYKGLSFAKPKADNWLPKSKHTLYWEGDGGDVEPAQTKTRHDMPISRKRWQFRQRQEHSRMVTGEES